jgi:AraC-like DNA-binding protein
MTEPVERVAWNVFEGGMALDCRETTRLWRVVHSHYAICLLHRGHSDWSYRRREFSFEPGALYICEPGEVHATRRVDGPGDFSVVFLEPELVREGAARLGIKNAPHFVPGRLSSAPLLHAYQSARHALSSPDPEYRAQEMSLLLYQLLEHSIPAPGRDELSPGKLYRAREHLRDLMGSRPESVVRLQPIAEELGLSYHALIHGFSRQFAIPPYEFVNQLRAQHVLADIVRGPDGDCATLSSLAHKWGYADGPHLSRAFKQYYRISPTDMARSLNPRWLRRPGKDR